MKNYKSKIFLATLFIVAMMGLQSCDDSKTEDTKDVAEEHNNAKFEDNKNEKDAQFLVDAAVIHRQEISLGKLAQQKGTTNHVKELGKMMEVDHTKALAELTTVAKTKNISLPTAQTDNEQDAYNKLNQKSGNDFGKEFSNMMVDGHKNAIALFEKSSTDGSDLEIKAWAASLLPALRTHLDHSLVCQKECSKM